jgi:hypothetical protein
MGRRCLRGPSVPGGVVPAKAEPGPSGPYGTASGVMPKAFACISLDGDRIVHLLSWHQVQTEGLCREFCLGGHEEAVAPI